jgi:23S rRNA (adenine2503-C2)-methyltransferase
MQDMKLGMVEGKFADIVWENAPISTKELVKLLKGLNCYVNLIPYNETENIGFKRTKKMQILAFYDILKKNGINVTIRKEFGSKVDAACGQLRANQN